MEGGVRRGTVAVRIVIVFLKLQAGNIISGIKTITEDVRIGFGSFVDKNLPPFARYRTDSTNRFHICNKNRCFLGEILLNDVLLN